MLEESIQFLKNVFQEPVQAFHKTMIVWEDVLFVPVAILQVLANVRGSQWCFGGFGFSHNAAQVKQTKTCGIISQIQAIDAV